MLFGESNVFPASKRSKDKHCIVFYFNYIVLYEEIGKNSQSEVRIVITKVGEAGERGIK